MKNLLLFLCAIVYFGLSSCNKPANSKHENVQELVQVLAQIDTLSDLEKQAVLLEKIAERWKDQNIGENAESIAIACRIVGNEFFGKEDFDKARQYYQIGLHFNPTGLIRGKLNSNFGMAYYNEKNFYSALPYFDEALRMQPAFPEDRYFINAKKYIGDAYTKLGQPNVAEQYLHEALESALKRKDTLDIGESCEFMSSCQRGLRKYTEAIKYGQKGIDALLAMDTSSLEFYDKQKYISTLANCSHNVGNAWQDSLQSFSQNTAAKWKIGEKAVLYYSKAQRAYQHFGLNENELVQMSNLGELHRRLGNTSEAVSLCDSAIAKVTSYSLSEAVVSRLLGRLYINRGEAFMNMDLYDKAKVDFDSAQFYLAPGQDGMPRLLKGPIANPEFVVMTLHDQALLSAKKERKMDKIARIQGLKTAIALYEGLTEFTNDIRKSYLSEADKIALSQRVRPYLDSAFLLSLELETLDPGNAQAYREQAFRFAEQSKAMALLESLQEKSWSAKLDERQQQQMAELKRERTAINNEIFKYRGDPHKQEALNKRWLAHLSKWRDFQESVSYAARQTAQAMNRSVGELRDKILGEGQAMLAYHEIDTVLYVFLLGKDDLQLAEVPIGKDFYPNIAQFEQLLSQPPSDSLKEKEAVFCAVSKRLYDQLLPAGLRRTLPIRLIVVPSDGLQTLPFEALWTSEEKGALDSSKQAEKHYLLFRHSFSYTPSANLLYEMRNNRANAKRPARVSILAPDFSNGRSLGDEGGAAQYVPLPNQDEAKAISKNVAAVKRLGPKANKDNFWNDCQAYPVLHIPTHGILSSDPRFNRIVLSSADKLAPSRYEYLHLHELYSHSERLDLDLLTLPACETGQGAAMKGEGKMSIARGLAALGIRSFVVAYWKINAYNSQELMPLFYGELAQPSNRFKDEALAQAKRDFIAGSSSHVHPFKWAGLMLIGDTDPVDLRRSNRSLVAYLWLLILPIVGGFLTRKRRSLQAVA